MASPDPVGTPQHVPPVDAPDHTASPELSAPSGWQKKVGSSKKGSASKRDVYFIAPDGEEIKTKRLLDRYLKSHTGCPAASEFDWSTGETPTRRSSRLSTKTRPSLDSPKGASAEKRRKKIVEDEKPKEEEKGEPEQVPADVPPPSIEKGDENMENVQESEVKPVEAPLASVNAEEAKAKVEAEAQNASEADVKGAQVEEEQKTETTPDKRAENEEPAKEDENKHESSSSLLKEESTEHKEGSDKISNVFQHCPEAPNASRQVDVST